MKGVSKSFLTCLVLLVVLSITLLLAGRERVKTYGGKEDLVYIRSGQNSGITYGLYQSRSIDEKGIDTLPSYEFVLLLRNRGDKFIQLGEIAEINFSMTDAKGKKVEVQLHSLAGGSLPYYDSTIVQFNTGRDRWLVPPFTLWIDSGTNVLRQWSLDIGKFKPVVKK